VFVIASETVAHDSGFLRDLATVMLVAGVVTIVFRLLRQPVVLGYILAGVLVSRNTPYIPLHINDPKTVGILSELGMILLMFSLGLHFSLRKLAQVGPTAFIAAIMEIVVMIAAGYGVGRAFGWSQWDSLFLGAILSISSTTIIIKALGDLGMAKEKFAELIFGVLIVEDILAIAMIALLSSVAASGTLAVGAVGLTLGKLVIFLAVVMIVGLLLVPPLMRYVARFKSNEMLLITALALCFGVSLLALYMEYSVALGAFLIGAIVAETREHGRINDLIEPVRDMFSAVFFVAIGMLIEPNLLVEYWLPILVITIVVVLGKLLSCGTGTFLAGHDARTSMRVGMGLSQIGEFSFIIAQLGITLAVTSKFVYPIAITVSAVTTLLTPYLIQASDPLVTKLSPIVPARLTSAADLYTRWVASLGAGNKSTVRRLLRRWMLQIVLNLVLVTAVFVIAAWMARRLKESFMDLPDWTGGTFGVLWLAAMVVSLPMLIVSSRKLRAVAEVVAEASTGRGRSREQTEGIRTFVSGVIRILGSLAIIVYLLLLSSTVMPPWPVLIVMLLVVIGITVWRWRTFERVYAKAQLSLSETLTPAPEPEVPQPTLVQSLAPVLRGVVLETVEIGPEAPARGKLIRELQLRTKSGASAVGIERTGENVINPGPDEELQNGDRLLLLGKPDQLQAARQLLLGDGTASALAK
jgi:CPA2 family monovalent cation:H+ antiporter-2